MEDRVGEVLARRAALDGGAAPAIVISILLHAAITGFAAWRALHTPPTTVSNVLTIQFKSLNPAPITAPRAAPLAAKPQPQPKMEVPEVAKPVTPPPVVKPAPNTVPLALTGKSTKKGAENVAPTPPPPAPAPVPGLKPGVGVAPGDVPVGGMGITGLEGDFRDAAYVERMRTLIGTHFLRAAATPGTTTTIYFVVDRDGRIRDAVVEKPSGNGTFDRNALRSVLESSPLPPLPFSYNGTFVGVHLIFK